MPEDATRGGDMAAGFWIRRVGSPAWSVTGTRRLARCHAATADNRNKENLLPVGPTWRRRRTATRSPLPEWYPRTPLKDITAIVNALERRRLQVQAARAAPMDRESETSSQNAVLISLSSQENAVLMSLSSPELSVSDQRLPVGSTPEPAPTCINSFLSTVEHPLQMSSASSSFSPHDDNSPQISCICNDLTPKNLHHTVNEEKLCSSIDQIEKLVKKNLKKTTMKEPAAKRATQRRTLMSMR